MFVGVEFSLLKVRAIAKQTGNHCLNLFSFAYNNK